MNLNDYSKRLGLMFNDDEKFKMLANKIDALIVFAINNLRSSDYRSPTFIDYFIAVSESPDIQNLSSVRDSMRSSNSFQELLFKYIVFSNTIEKHIYNQYFINVVHNFLPSELDDLNIPYEIIIDNDGSFIFPKGAKELDNALIFEPLEWMSDYPKSRKQWVSALEHYSEITEDNVSETVDIFRKSVESFFQEFFGGNKSLEKYKSEYGNYLKSQNIPKEIADNFEAILQAYMRYINNYAKHQDKANINAAEYIMYQSGNIIRLLITLKQRESNT